MMEINARINSERQARESSIRCGVLRVLVALEHLDRGNPEAAQEMLENALASFRAAGYGERE